jgi:hypothetical protein
MGFGPQLLGLAWAIQVGWKEPRSVVSQGASFTGRSQCAFLWGR